MANNLSLSNVINVTLVPSIQGLSEFNTANLLLYSTEQPITFFDGDYRIYKGADGVAKDFGVNSLTFKMAVAVFSQTPNILSNSGALIIALKRNDEPQVEAFYRLKQQIPFCGWMTTASIQDDVNENKPSFTVNASIDATLEPDSIETIKAIENPSINIALDVLPDESSGEIEFVTIDFDLSEAQNIDDVANILQDRINEEFGGGGWNVFVMDNKFHIQDVSKNVNNILVGDNTFSEAIKLDSSSNPEITERSSFNGITDAIQAENNKINFVVSNRVEDIGGFEEDITSRGNRKTRCLFYGGTEEEAKVMMAAYASKAMSTVFEASLTTQTMHLKPLTGVAPDPTIDETLLQDCKDAGIDTYVSIEGVSCVFSVGANGFFDEVFNELWFVNAIQVAGFNYLRQTNTKIPQTEAGMTGLKNAYAQVCVRGINNGFIAAGSWTLPDTFGNPDSFKKNIENIGYYIYSMPVAQQTQDDREERKAPLVQIAIKTAGAIHSTNVMIYVNL